MKTLIKEVENGTRPLLKAKYKNTWLFTVYKGQKQLYSHDDTMPGVTVYYQNRYEPTTTIVYCPDINRAIQLTTDIQNKRDAIHKSQQELGEYIRENKMY